MSAAVNNGANLDSSAIKGDVAGDQVLEETKGCCQEIADSKWVSDEKTVLS